MTRVAAIDCGTNSIRLLVADLAYGATLAPGAPGAHRAPGVTASLTTLDRRMRIVRLGQGVDRTGSFAPDALERTFDACRDYAGVIDGLGAERVRFVATSATRDAGNRAEFVAGVRAILGVEPEVVSGDEEALLSFSGATRELDRAEHAGPYLVVDIGGGSTELVLGDRAPRASRSIDVGCVRLHERHLHTDPPTASEIALARTDIEAALDAAAADVPLAQGRTLVGLAGSVTTVAAMALDLPAYDSERIHLSRVSAGDVRTSTARLLAMTRAERAALPFMHPGRVDVIGAGALVLSCVIDRVVPAGIAEVVVSEHDILDGIAWSLA